MARHGVQDPGNKAHKLNKRFLSGLPTGASEAFEYFRVLMMGLKEEVTGEEFSSLLDEYLERFVILAEGSG